MKRTKEGREGNRKRSHQQVNREKQRKDESTVRRKRKQKRHASGSSRKSASKQPVSWQWHSYGDKHVCRKMVAPGDNISEDCNLKNKVR